MIILDSGIDKNVLQSFIEIFGLSATIFSLFRPIPQIYKIFFIKSGKDISYHTLFIGIAYNSLFVLSGVMAHDKILWIANLIMLFINVFLIIITYYFNKKGSKADRKMLEEECVKLLIEHTKRQNLKIKNHNQIVNSFNTNSKINKSNNYPKKE